MICQTQKVVLWDLMLLELYFQTQNQLKNIGLDIDLGQTFTDDQNKYEGLTNIKAALTDRILAESKDF